MIYTLSFHGRGSIFTWSAELLKQLAGALRIRLLLHLLTRGYITNLPLQQVCTSHKTPRIRTIGATSATW